MTRLDESSPAWIRKQLLMQRYAQVTSAAEADRAMLRDVLSVLAHPDVRRLTRAWLEAEEVASRERTG